MAIARALVRHVADHTLIAKSESGHWVPVDSPAQGVPTAANSPVQLLLIACAGCVTIDIVTILTKGRHALHALEIEIEAIRRDDLPRIIRRLDFHVRVGGDALREDAVRRAVELSLTKYCSVSLSLDRSVPFTAHLSVNGAAATVWDIPRDPALYT